MNANYPIREAVIIAEVLLLVLMDLLSLLIVMVIKYLKWTSLRKTK